MATRRHRQQQQGDVCIERAKIPAGASARNSLVLAEGEVTGHAHRVIPLDGATAHLLALGDKLFMRIQGGDCRVVHEEHREQVVGPGEYEVSRVLEYDYDAEEVRVVAD